MPGSPPGRGLSRVVSIDAHAEDASSFERVTSGTEMGLIFGVAEGSFLDIDVEITGLIIK